MGVGTATNGPAGNISRSLPPHLLKAVAKVTELGSLPEITTKIVQIVEDPRATARDMHDVVRADPPLAAKILKVVNSAFYGLPSQIASLDRAILMLGLSAVKNIALAASLSRLFKADAVSEQFAARDFWRHSVATAVGAREIAKLADHTAPDEAFVGGLVHDVGLIVALQVLPDKMREVAETCFNQPQDFLSVEQRIIGADHQLFGGVMALKWKFPPALCDAISTHHDPLAAPAAHQPCVAAVHLADLMCAQRQIGFWLTGQTRVITDEVLEVASVSRTQLEHLAEQLPDHVEEAESIFGT
jgi:HD-like signal output (HDOD) protein